MNLLGRSSHNSSKDLEATSPIQEGSRPAMTSAGQVAAATEADRPQLRVADRFARPALANQSHIPKPLPATAGASIPAAARGARVPSAPQPPASTQPSSAATFAPTQSLRVNRTGSPEQASRPQQRTASTRIKYRSAQGTDGGESITSSEDGYGPVSSEDMQHSSSASGSLPETPSDDQHEWVPTKQAAFASIPSRLPPGAGPSAYQTPQSSPSRSRTYSPSTPFTPPLSPSESPTSSPSSYNPMAAFFGTATPPSTLATAYGSPPPSSPSTPVGPRAPVIAQPSQTPPPRRTNSGGIPQPPSMYSDDEEDPYKEFAKPKARPAMAKSLVASALSPPTSPTLSKSQLASPLPLAPARPSTNRRMNAEASSSHDLRSKNSFYTGVSAASAAPKEAPPPVPTGAVSRVAAAVQAAEAHRLAKLEHATGTATAQSRKLSSGPSPSSATTTKPVSGAGSNSSDAAATSTKPQKRRPSESDVSVSKIPVSPAAKLGKKLPSAPLIAALPVAVVPPPLVPVPVADPRGSQRPRGAPSAGNLRAAALAQSASRNAAEAPRGVPATAATTSASVAVDQGAASPAVPSDVEAEALDAREEEEAPLAPRFEHALSTFPATILVPILAQLSYADFRSLRVVSKTMLTAAEDSAREVVLQRFLGPHGYRTLNPVVPAGSVATRGTGSVVIHSTKQAQVDVAARRRFGGSEAGHGSLYTSQANKSPAAKADTAAPGGVELTLKDLHGFMKGLEVEVRTYARLARDCAHDQLPDELARMARSSTRGYNRVILRLRAQSELRREAAQPPYLFDNLAKAAVPVYKAGRAPMLRVWVPTAKGQSWMGDEEVVECEREVWRTGVWNLLRRGDIVHNVAVGDFANDGKLVSDGKYLRDLEFAYDAVGHCPAWIDMLSFAPSYYHNLIASSSNNPVFYLSLKAFAGKIRESLLLCTDRVQVSSPQGNYLVKRFVYRGATKVRPGTIIGSGGGAGGSGPGGIEVVHEAWAGQVVVETEGTTEHATMLLARCESAVPTPWVVLRDKSRPDCIWLRPVTDDEAI